MHDPKLRRRLCARAYTGRGDLGPELAPEPYGRAHAASFPNGRFEPVPQAGHLPHLEQPEQVLEAIYRFADETTRSATT
jgi:pimeloyl-ACP methyl ester carboxylesterase